MNTDAPVLTPGPAAATTESDGTTPTDTPVGRVLETSRSTESATHPVPSVVAAGPGTSFGAMLRSFRLRTPGHTAGNRFGRATDSMSQWDLAAAAAIDPTYVSLLERGKRQVVTRSVVLAFADALDLSAAETDRLLYAAGLAPQADYQARCEDYERRFAEMVALLPALPSTLSVLKERASCRS